MKVGDLIQYQRKWLALVLAVDKKNMTADVVWLDGVVDSCSTSLLRVLSEGR